MLIAIIHYTAYIFLIVIVAISMTTGGVASRACVLRMIVGTIIINVVAKIPPNPSYMIYSIYYDIITDIILFAVVIRYAKNATLLIDCALGVVGWIVYFAYGHWNLPHMMAVNRSMDIFPLLSEGLLLWALILDRRYPPVPWSQVFRAIVTLPIPDRSKAHAQL